MGKLAVVCSIVLTTACGARSSLDRPFGREVAPIAPADRGLADGPAGARDGGTAPDGPPIPGCSPQGVAAPCDPLTNRGCAAEAACYVIKGIGSACVCPTGTIRAGGDCTTSAKCVPNHGCQGSVPPGTCVPYCDAKDPECSDPSSPCPQCPAEAARCIPITGYMEFSICKP